MSVERENDKSADLQAERLSAEKMMAGQRRVNLIWEFTQSLIALIVVCSAMATGIVGYLRNNPQPTPTIVTVAFGTVVGFYFGRTNHAAIGGLGPKPNPPYEGR